MTGGLVSISFRELTVDEIIEIVSEANLKAIEWGGDIHVPHGNINIAKNVFKKCQKKNITCPSYGSYYKVGLYENPVEEFNKVLNCAKELHSKTIRIWAGDKSTKDSDKNHWIKIVNESQMLCDLAKLVNISISFEYHSNTLTDNANDTLKLIKLINRENIFTYWQPPIGTIIENNCTDIDKLLNHISNVHVFQWVNGERLPLKEGIEAWKIYLKMFKNESRYFLLEFIKDNDKIQFLKDAKILKELLNE